MIHKDWELYEQIRREQILRDLRPTPALCLEQKKAHQLCWWKEILFNLLCFPHDDHTAGGLGVAFLSSNL